MKDEEAARSRIFLVSYPKIIYLYPTFVVSLVAAIYLSVAGQPLDMASTETILVSVVFLGVWVTNLVVLAFFPRTSSLSLFFVLAAAIIGCVLLSVLKPEVLPYVAGKLEAIHPLANASFYWVFSLSLGLATLGAMIVARFDYWEARPNELLHHQGLRGDPDRFPTPGVPIDRIDKKVTDVFGYLLLHSCWERRRSTSARKAGEQQQSSRGEKVGGHVRIDAQRPFASASSR